MPTYQDGTIPSGAPTLTINSVTYICNSFQFPQYSADTTSIKDANGNHAAAIQFAGPTTGSAQLQVASNSTAFPTTASINSVTGTFTVTNGVSNVNCFITSASISKPATGPWLVDIGFQQKQN